MTSYVNMTDYITSSKQMDVSFWAKNLHKLIRDLCEATDYQPADLVAVQVIDTLQPTTYC